MTQPSQWQTQPERGSRFSLWLIRLIALHVGRGVARLLLIPISLYFLLMVAPARRASARYMTRVLGRKPGWSELARHFHTFAACTLDRILLLAGRTDGIPIRVHQSDALLRLAREKRGCLLLVSHLGSFEALRVPGTLDYGLPLRILLDRQQGVLLTQLLEALNPALASQVIDASQRGPGLVLAMKEALEQGHMIGMMADRVLPQDASVSVRLLDGEVSLPASPWLLAGSLGVPVILGFGLYRDGGYDGYFELFAERIELPRAERAASLRAQAQRYAQRLEHHLRAAPYNWFNFYDYWNEEKSAAH